MINPRNCFGIYFQGIGYFMERTSDVLKEFEEMIHWCSTYSKQISAAVQRFSFMNLKVRIDDMY